MPVFVHLAVEICCNLIADNVAVENYKLEKKLEHSQSDCK